MAAIYTYTGELVTCPYPGCHKAFDGLANWEYRPPWVVVCKQCGRKYTVEIATYKTTTEEVK